MRVSAGVRGGRRATLDGVLARSGPPVAARVQAPAISASAAALARILVQVTPGSCREVAGLTSRSRANDIDAGALGSSTYTSREVPNSARHGDHPRVVRFGNSSP